MNNEHTLISLVLQGDSRAFETLLASVQFTAFRCIRKYIQQQDDVNDIFQDCVEKAWRKMSTGQYQCRVDSGFQAWFITIVKNRSIDELRRRRSRKSVFFPDVFVLNQPSSSDTADRHITHREAEEYWELVLSRLSAVEQMVIRERYEEYQDFDQIVTKTGINSNTLRGTSRRAREKIRHIVNKKPPR